MQLPLTGNLDGSGELAATFRAFPGQWFRYNQCHWWLRINAEKTIWLPVWNKVTISAQLQSDRLPAKPTGAFTGLFGKGVRKLASANYFSHWGWRQPSVVKAWSLYYQYTFFMDNYGGFTFSPHFVSLIFWGLFAMLCFRLSKIILLRLIYYPWKQERREEGRGLPCVIFCRA